MIILTKSKYFPPQIQNQQLTDQSKGYFRNIQCIGTLGFSVGTAIQMITSFIKRRRGEGRETSIKFPIM